MTEQMNDIKNIENKYGFVLFRMGLTHLADFGHRNLEDDAVDECIAQIMAEGEEERVNGKIPIMTPEFQCGIVRCAAELAQFSIWTLFTYIKKYVIISK